MLINGSEDFLQIADVKGSVLKSLGRDSRRGGNSEDTGTNKSNPSRKQQRYGKASGAKGSAFKGQGHTLPLTDLGAGERARVVRLEGGRGLRQKLALRGLTEGCIVRVVSNHGPITVEFTQGILCIGRGMARKVRVMEM